MRIWEFVSERKGVFIRVAEFCLVAGIFFGLGMMYAWDSASKKHPIEVIEPLSGDTAALAAGAMPIPSSPKKTAQKAVQRGAYVASKNGSKYYPDGCANRIKEENKIYFTTKEDAEKAGFSIAKNCSQ